MDGLSLKETQRAVESNLRILKATGGRESDPVYWCQLELLSEALKDLPSSWREPHPGVFKTTWTFASVLQLRSDRGYVDGIRCIEDYRHAHLDTAIDNLESARRGISLDDQGQQLLVPLYVRICDENDIATDTCQACGGCRPVVLRTNVGAGCDRDFLEVRSYALCLPCRRLTLTGKKLEPFPDLSL